MDNIFLTAFERVSGRKFFKGPTGLFGFWSGVMLACPIGSRYVLVSKLLLIMVANRWWTLLVEYFRSSLGIPSGPFALPFFKLLEAA